MLFLLMLELCNKEHENVAYAQWFNQKNKTIQKAVYKKTYLINVCKKTCLHNSKRSFFFWSSNIIF